MSGGTSSGMPETHKEDNASQDEHSQNVDQKSKELRATLLELSKKIAELKESSKALNVKIEELDSTREERRKRLIGSLKVVSNS